MTRVRSSPRRNVLAEVQGKPPQVSAEGTAAPAKAGPARRKSAKPAAVDSAPSAQRDATEKELQVSAMLGIVEPDMLLKVSADLMSLSSTPTGTRKDILEAGVLVVRSLAPTNMTEALLAIQMAAIHQAIVRHGGALTRAQTAYEIELAQAGLNKLARTFTMQIDALQKLRDGGTRTMRIERVTISDGGQAIIGNLPPPGGTLK